MERCPVSETCGDCGQPVDGPSAIYISEGTDETVFAFCTTACAVAFLEQSLEDETGLAMAALD
jgi:hypothetical protein